MSGEDALEREGMWAFAWYNEESGRLLLCRDRFGEKPLYFYESDQNLYFASEPKAIFTLLGKSLPININQINSYLVNGYKSLYKNYTFYEGLKKFHQALHSYLGIHFVKKFDIGNQTLINKMKVYL